MDMTNGNIMHTIIIFSLSTLVHTLVYSFFLHMSIFRDLHVVYKGRISSKYKLTPGITIPAFYSCILSCYNYTLGINLNYQYKSEKVVQVWFSNGFCKLISMVMLCCHSCYSANIRKLEVFERKKTYLRFRFSKLCYTPTGISRQGRVM